jgi:hypothetical protein
MSSSKYEITQILKKNFQNYHIEGWKGHYSEMSSYDNNLWMVLKEHGTVLITIATN